MVDRVNNFVQLFNEGLILIFVIFLFMFTDYLDPTARNEIGIYFIWLTYVLIGFNGGNIVLQVIWKVME
jgi:hypothetical protein